MYSAIYLTPFVGLYKNAGAIYCGLALLVAAAAMWFPRRWLVKVPIGLVVLAGFAYPVWRADLRSQEQQAAHEERLRPALKLFEERCKTAGETITRTVHGVDGIVWMKHRPKGLNRSDQYVLNDPYGSDCEGMSCVELMLRVTIDPHRDQAQANLRSNRYDFIETTDENGQKWRHIGAIKVIHKRTNDERRIATQNGNGVDPGVDVYGYGIISKPIEKFTARYGATWNDISTKEDRDHWIAGGSVTVMDLSSGEVVAERRGYMLDTGLGSEVGFRSPWLEAARNACPTFGNNDGHPNNGYHSREFVQRVLLTREK